MLVVEGGRLIPLSVQHCTGVCVCKRERERGSLVFTYLRYLHYLACIYIYII